MVTEHQAKTLHVKYWQNTVNCTSVFLYAAEFCGVQITKLIVINYTEIQPVIIYQ